MLEDRQGEIAKGSECVTVVQTQKCLPPLKEATVKTLCLLEFILIEHCLGEIIKGFECVTVVRTQKLLSLLNEAKVKGLRVLEISLFADHQGEIAKSSECGAVVPTQNILSTLEEATVKALCILEISLFADRQGEIVKEFGVCRCCFKPKSVSRRSREATVRPSTSANFFLIEHCVGEIIKAFPECVTIVQDPEASLAAQLGDGQGASASLKFPCFADHQSEIIKGSECVTVVQNPKIVSRRSKASGKGPLPPQFCPDRTLCRRDHQGASSKCLLSGPKSFSRLLNEVTVKGLCVLEASLVRGPSRRDCFGGVPSVALSSPPTIFSLHSRRRQ